MKIRTISIFTFLLFLLNQISLSQESFEFKTQEYDITIFPSEPGVCTGKSSDVTCVEEFESYKWEMVNPVPQFEVLYGQTQDLQIPGEYVLTVEKIVNNVLCSKQLFFEVHDLKSSEGIENYLLNNGFYPIPIIIDQSSIQNEKVSESRMMCELNPIKFSSEFEYVDLNSATAISDLMSDFKPFANEGYETAEVKSQNSCICDIGINELEDAFYSNTLSFWAHEFTVSEDDTNGKLYIKAFLPFVGDSPINAEHQDQIDNLFSQIISDEQNNADQDKASSEHLRILFSNLAMPHPTGGYELETECQVSYDEVGENYLMTPAQIAVQLPQGISDIYMDNDISSPAYGSFIQFNYENKQWQNYQRNEDFIISNGYFNPINAEFFEGFTTSLTECNDCVIDLVSISQGCENFSCTFETNQYTTEYFDLDAVNEGGFNYEISSCHATWTYWPLSKRGSKTLIYDLLCAIKNGDPTFEYDSNHSGKVIFAKDIILADAMYEVVGVKLPKEGNTIELLDTPILNNNGTTKGFKNAFEISTDKDVRLNFLKIGNNTVKNNCSNLVSPSYKFAKWDIIAAKLNDCIEYYNLSEKYQLIDYLDPPDKENLLIMVNGYRILGLSPGKKWYKGGVEYPTQDAEDAINSCYDNFEDGDYWGDAGVNFAKRINNNVLYVDGHHSIATSNHIQMASDIMSQTSFLASVVSCLPKKYLCLNINCTLNDIPNGSGFFIRYTNGLGAGVLIWNKMVAGDIDVGLSADKTQITGKIDIAAHSMGYAYSKGMLDYLTDKLAPGNTFGNYYIIAPENAIAYSDEEFESYDQDLQDDVVVDLSLFESVYQYGSDFTPNGDKKCQQDGVAPQVRVRGLPSNNNNNVFIPDSEAKNKNFVDAHLMKNYGWLFEIPEDIKGYIKSRN